MFTPRKKIYPEKVLSKKKKPFLKIFLIILAFLLLTGYLVNYNLLGILNLKIESNSLSCLSNEQTEKEIMDYKLTLLNLKSDDLKNKIKSKNLCVKNVEQKIILPNNLLFIIEDRTPFAEVSSLEFATASSLIDINNLFLSTQSGILNLTTNNFTTLEKLVLDDSYFFYTKKNALSQLPNLNLVQENIALNSKASNIISAGVNVLISLKQLNIGVVENLLFKNIFIISLSEDKKIILDLEKDVIKQIGSLTLILQKANMESKIINSIDLRFDKPVVIYTKSDR